MDVAGTIIGGLILLIVGFVAKQVSGINTEFKELNNRFYKHVIEPGIHHSGFAQVREHVDAVESKVNVAHKRIDAVESKGG